MLGNYTELKVLVGSVGENSLEITEENLERTVELRLLKNAIKPIPDNKRDHFPIIDLNIMDISGGFSAFLKLSLSRYA
ncbi:MAG TPA: hypothetical protein DCS60_04375 [Opitutae bacterium]|nr:hypothetical protein [Opitutae bacterium]